MPVIDRAKFFATARVDPGLFAGSLSQTQVDGISGLLDGWERDHAALDRRWLAYALATTFHETARTFRPIEEYGKGKGRKYGIPVPPKNLTYYGRGYVQLTWDYNYRKLGERIGVDLLGDPALAMVPEIAAKVLFVGMIEGLFSGHKLSDSFDGPKADWQGARRIINGTDKAEMIAGYGRTFLKCLTP